MNEHPFQDWLNKAEKHSGILACGVRLANQSVAVKSFDESLPEARIGDLLQCLAEVAFGLRNAQLGGSRMRWVFEHGQLHSARRQDGALAVLALSKDQKAGAAIEEMFDEFMNAIGPAPEKPILVQPEAAPESGAAAEAGGNA